MHQLQTYARRRHKKELGLLRNNRQRTKKSLIFRTEEKLEHSAVIRIIKANKMHYLNFILVKNSTCFGQT